MLGTMSVEYKEGNRFLVLKDDRNAFLPTEVAMNKLLEFGACGVKSERVLKVWFKSGVEAKRFANSFGRETSIQEIFRTTEEGRFQRNETEESRVSRSDRFVGGEIIPHQNESRHSNSSNQPNNPNYPFRRDRFYDREAQNGRYRKTGDQNYRHNVSGQPMYNRQNDFRYDFYNQDAPSFHGNYEQPVNSQPQPPMDPYYEHLNQPYFEHPDDQYIPNFRPPPPPPMNAQRNDSDNNLFVFHLPQDVDDRILREMFSGYGDIVSVKVMMKPDGSSRGFGFVMFERREDAETAQKCMNRYKVGEIKFLKVEFKSKRNFF